MPTYEYECEKCGFIFEEFQSITAEPLKKCVKQGCGGSVKRLLSGGAGFLFKGSGFYITDYRSDSYKKAAKSETGIYSTKHSDKTSGASGDAAPSATNAAPAKKGTSGNKD